MPQDPETRPTILIVEDIVFIRMMTEDYFESAGFRTLSARSTADAIALLETDPTIRYLFADIHLPDGEDGQKLAEIARKRWPPVKIILTSADMPADQVRLPIRGLFVPKPYSLDQVRKTFETMT
ncbi:response regulator [Gluconobacter sp. Dm-74]|uniref:response regulator n=1 Tax=Gluconobacter sp. Dm-74 TaxID=2799803 RepID=UPI001B8BE3D5|nr:response regulator [Gluconobacter sp. Dm-74]MBS1090153.1 response regulator [Gluconobacter sp. Dm-74]